MLFNSIECEYFSKKQINKYFLGLCVCVCVITICIINI